MGCECEKPDDASEEVRAEDSQIKDFRMIIL